MKEQSFDNDVNSLTGMSNSNSGAPSAIDEQAPTDAFERSWDWDFEVRELGPDETAECKVTMGADDLANLTVDGEERLDIGPRGQYGGGSYEPQTASFIIEPGMHRAHVDYSNISIPNANNNIAKFSFDLKVEITNRQTGSSSSYVPRRRKRSQWTTTTRATMIHAEAPAAEAAVLPTAVPAIHALMATTAGMRMRLIRTILFPRMTAWTTGAVPPVRLPCAAWFPPPPHMEGSLPQADG